MTRMTIGDILKFKESLVREPEKRYWHGDIGDEDDFGMPIGDAFVDGRTRMGPWACMSLASHAEYGVGLGTGYGQKYEKQADGRWLKVAG